MITTSHTNRGVFFIVIRYFLFTVFFAAVMYFCKPCFSEESATEKEYKAQKKFLQLQSSVDEEDYIMAQFVLNSFKEDFADTDFYKKYSKKTNELASNIKKKTKSIKVEDKIEYLFVPARLETKLWQEYMSHAEMIIAQRQGRIGVTVLRVVLEDGDIERPSVMSDRSSQNQIHIYQGYGYSLVGNCQSGDAVFVGSEFWNCGVSCQSDKINQSAIGDIIIGGIYHYPTKLKIEVEKGKAIAFGEVIVRSIPQKYCGNLIVKVEAEEGAELTNANVSLSVSGSYAGVTKPLKNNSCIFSSVGSGSYSVKLGQNDNFGSTNKSAAVVLGQTTEVTINAYRHRIIEFDWRFHRATDPNNWISGKKTMKTTESWQPDDEWPDVHYPVVEFGDWIGDTCKIRSSNGSLMHIDTNEPFETMKFPSGFSGSYRDYPIKEGDVFAWRRNARKDEGFIEALIHIRKITPIKF